MKLEEKLYSCLEEDDEHTTTSKGDGAKYPPQCDQFIRHQSLYLPSETLDSFKLEYSTVSQYQNEMLITFPYAYRQAYNTGPNIAEEMAYASRRWEVFHQKHLYQSCGPDCPEKAPELDLGFIHASRERVAGCTNEPAENLDTSIERTFDEETSSSSSDDCGSKYTKSLDLATIPIVRPAPSLLAVKTAPTKALEVSPGCHTPEAPIVPGTLSSSKLSKDTKRDRDDQVLQKVDDLFSSASKRQRKDY